MGTTALRQTSKSRDFFLVLFFCLIGILARLILIGQVPYGLNQDEASAGYEAWSILNYGIDRHGISYPVHLIAWGSGQNIAYSWFCMPIHRVVRPFRVHGSSSDGFDRLRFCRFILLLSG